MTDAKVVEKKIYEEGKKHDDYASKATIRHPFMG